VLLDYNSPNAVEKEIRRVVCSVQEAALLDLHVWRVGPGAYSAIVALSARNGTHPAQLRKRLGRIHRLDHVTIEINPTEDEEHAAAKAFPAENERPHVRSSGTRDEYLAVGDIFEARVIRKEHP
jgi:hypothetical protein